MSLRGREAAKAISFKGIASSAFGLLATPKELLPVKLHIPSEQGRIPRT